MQKSTKRALSFSVLIAAAVVFGMVVAGSVNVTPRSEAQREAPAAAPFDGPDDFHRSRPSFADIADEAMPSVVSITSTDIVKGAGRRAQSPSAGAAAKAIPSSSSSARAATSREAATTKSTRKSRAAPVSSSRKTATS